MTEDERPSPKPHPFCDEALAELRRKIHELGRPVSEARPSARETTRTATELPATISNGNAKIVEKLAKITKFLGSGEYVVWLGLISARAALERDDLGENEKCQLLEEANSFEKRMLEIISNFDKSNKETAVGAILSALLIGLDAGADEQVRQKIKDEALAMERRGRVEPAAKARKAEPIGELIKRLCEDLRQRRPPFKGNSRGTAVKIFPVFNAELSKLPDRPKSWLVLNLEDGKSEKARVRARFDEAKEKAIDRIRKRIERLYKEDSHRLST